MLAVGAVADPLQSPSGELAFEHAEEFPPEPGPVERRRNTLCPLGKIKLAKLEHARLRSRPLSRQDPKQAALAASHIFHAPDDGARRAPGFEDQLAEFHCEAPLGPRQIKQLDAVLHDDRMVEFPNKATSIPSASSRKASWAFFGNSTIRSACGTASGGLIARGSRGAWQESGARS